MRAHRAAMIALLTVEVLAGTAACATAPSGRTPSAPVQSAPAQSLPAQSSAPSSGSPAPASEVSGPGSLTEFKGHIVCGPPVRVETSTEAGDHQELRGGAWTPTATEMGDLRLAGEYTISTNSNVYGGAGSARYELLSGTWRIETKDGAWKASFTRVGFPDGSVSTVTTPLVGEGGHAGMFAVWEARYLGDAACAWDIRGVIFPAAPPEPPTAP